jgi:hypothetical protein
LLHAGPDEQCGDSRDRSEIKCCTDTSATNCVPASDSGYCPIDYPASYCIVCDADKWKPSEVASLALGVVGAVCGVAGSVLAVVQFSLQRRKEKKEATAAAAKAAVAAAAAAPLQIKVTVPHADVAEP